jgi:MoxR-like ATPase
MPTRGSTSSRLFPQDHGDEIEYTVRDALPKDTPGIEARRSTRVTRDPYRVRPELADAVNLAIALGRPLLVQGDPGVGKTSLAKAVADSFEIPFERAYIKSTSRAQDLLYTFDAVRRLYDLQTPPEPGRPRELDPARYLQLGPLGRAIVRSQYNQQSVVLIDEIDKADIDFPNDLLRELDELAFDVPEVPSFPGRAAPKLRPIVIITNNEEKSLPEAFLRRCVFHYIEFPESVEDLDHILQLHEITRADLRTGAASMIVELRKLGLSRPPGLSELLDWVGYLELTDAAPASVTELAHAGALLKTRDDHERTMKWLRGT